MQRVMPSFVDVLRSAARNTGSRDVIAMCEDLGLVEVCAVVRRIASKIKRLANPGLSAPADVAEGHE